MHVVGELAYHKPGAVGVRVQNPGFRLSGLGTRKLRRRRVGGRPRCPTPGPPEPQDPGSLSLALFPLLLVFSLTHTLTLSLSLAHTHTLSLSRNLSLSVSRCLSLSHTHTQVKGCTSSESWRVSAVPDPWSTQASSYRTCAHHMYMFTVYKGVFECRRAYTPLCLWCICE